MLSHIMDKVLIGTIQEQDHPYVVLYTNYEKAFAQERLKILYYFIVFIKSLT